MTLESQYTEYLRKYPDSTLSFEAWKVWFGNSIKDAFEKMEKSKNIKANIKK